MIFPDNFTKMSIRDEPNTQGRAYKKLNSRSYKMNQTL